MPLFSSISDALERIHFPTNLNLDSNSSVGYLSPFIQGQHISATTVASAAAILAASYHVLFNVYEINKPKGFRDIPKISSWSMLYNTIFKEMHTSKRHYKVMKKTMDEHGIARVNQFGRDIVYLGTPEYARQLLLHTETFPKLLPKEQFPPNSFAGRFFGGSIVSTNGSEWKHHRKVCNPAFHKSWSTNVFGESTIPMLELIASKTKNGEKSIDMTNMLKRLTLDALGNAAFGFNFDSVNNPNNDYVITYNYIMHNAFKPIYVLLPWLDTIPFFRRSKLLAEVDRFHSLISTIIKEKRQTLHDAKEQGIPPENRDLLAMMVEANESEEDTLTDQELRSDVKTFFVAGHDTTSNALTCELYHLAIRPDLQEKLYTEISSIIGPATASNPNPIPTIDQLKDVELLDAVIKEGMRLYPSVPFLPPRHVSSNIQVGPYVIPPGVRIQLNIYSIHHNPKYWDNPREFRPERFLPNADGNVEKRDPNAWIPFSYGSRSCIGSNFSLIEQRVVLAMIIHRFKFALPADSPHKNELQFLPSGLTTADELNIEFTPRY